MQRSFATTQQSRSASAKRRVKAMKRSMLSVFALMGAMASAHAQNLSPDDLARRTVQRRAVEAAIWGMPLVNTDAMRQAYFRHVGANYNDICYFSKHADWRFQVPTPTPSPNPPAF